MLTVMDNLAALFGRRLKQLRKEQGLTQQDVAKQVRLDDKHLGALERGEKAPSFDAVERLAAALKVEPYRLFMPDRMASGQLEETIRLVMRDLDQIDRRTLEAFLGDLLTAVRKLERRPRP